MPKKKTMKKRKKQEVIEVPNIFGENVYYKKSRECHSKRRDNEVKIMKEVKGFFLKNNYSIIGNHKDYYNEIEAQIVTLQGLINVKFEYRESWSRIRKSLSVYLDGEQKDLRLIKKKSTYLKVA